MGEIGKIDIKQAAISLGVNPETLRRWDRAKRLIARRDTPTAHRYYFETDLADWLMDNYKYLSDLAERWAFAKTPAPLSAAFYCEDSFVFKARLARLENELLKDKTLADTFSLITSVVGEIGNNSFDHNIGNWPDVPGIFFGWCLRSGKIILADRGQGVLATLKRAKPDLANDQEALRAAFTLSLSGRGPEKRGNGLKYVRKVVVGNKLDLFFQSGQASVKINKRSADIKPVKEDKYLSGTLAILAY
ncbi:MAG: MerR family DNA-binding transcriptional regulator [Patescibacteria group bacterium]